MILNLIYLFCAVLFIFSIYGLSSPTTARRGNFIGIAAMVLAIGACLITSVHTHFAAIYITLAAGIFTGFLAGKKIKMTALPQMVALLNGLGGLASALIVLSETVLTPTAVPFINILCIIIGLLTFSGSLVAFAKLQGLLTYTPKNAKWFSLLLLLMLTCCAYHFWHTGEMLYPLTILSLLLGITFTLPVGGADMPIIISVLNALSGWAIVLVGLSLNDLLLIIVGTLIGASGSILSQIMTRAMNRSLFKILWPDKTLGITAADTADKTVKSGTPAEAAFLLENSRKVIIVPGFGMAAAQAQNALKNMADILENKYHVEVKFAIHPVAGRMPGHMNVLLAEAKIPYEDVYELNDINAEFSTADAAYIIGANDVTNPSAKTDSASPLYGMPVLDVEKARTVFFVKRSMASGYSGVDNPLFYAPNTIMLFGDAKKITEEISKEL